MGVMEPDDVHEATRLRRAIEAVPDASEVEFIALVGPANGVETMPSLRCRTKDTASEVEIYFEDPLLAHVEVRSRAWLAHRDLRADWLETDAGVRWLVDLIRQRWIATRRFHFIGAQVLRASSPGPHLVLLPRR